MKKIVPYCLICLTIFCNNYSYSQTACTNGFADIYPCNNYDLLSNIPISVLANLSGEPEGSDIWGWTDSLDNKEYAIIATTNSTAFVNVSDPVNPIFLGRIDTETHEKIHFDGKDIIIDLSKTSTLFGNIWK